MISKLELEDQLIIEKQSKHKKSRNLFNPFSKKLYPSLPFKKNSKQSDRAEGSKNNDNPQYEHVL